MLLPRDWHLGPPPAKDAVANNPTLLLSWWCTGFALAIIIVRISGRYVRTEKLFREDKLMALSIIPLLARMALVHLILIWGTNNAITTSLAPLDIQHRTTGSKLVLASRIMYAAFLWIAKFTVSEFLKRLTSQVWKKSYEVGLQFIRWFLAVTFIAVVIATLAECQPFSGYWQVIPDPGAKCRQGHAQLITMGASDVITDLLLIVFPIPIVIKSHMTAKRKLSLVLLFSLSFILVGITIYRVIAVIDRHSDQQFRSLLASLEILAAAAVSNAVVLGSFIRDRGEKKKRFRFGSTGGNSSLDTASQQRTRTITQRHWGSDADLVGDLGMRLGTDLEERHGSVPRPAPIALPLASHAHVTPKVTANSNWNFPARPSAGIDETDLKATGSDLEKPPSPTEIPMPTPRRMSFFDVGGLLDDPHSPAYPHHPPTSSVSPIHVPHMTHETQSSTPVQQHRRGSHALLEDIGGLPFATQPVDQMLRCPQQPEIVLQPAPATRNFSRPNSRNEILPVSSGEGRVSPVSSPSPRNGRHQHNCAQSLQDAGGLLS